MAQLKLLERNATTFLPPRAVWYAAALSSTPSPTTATSKCSIIPEYLFGYSEYCSYWINRLIGWSVFILSVDDPLTCWSLS